MLNFGICREKDASNIFLTQNCYLAGGFKYFLFSPLPEEMIQID